MLLTVVGPRLRSALALVMYSFSAVSAPIVKCRSELRAQQELVSYMPPNDRSNQHSATSTLVGNRLQIDAEAYNFLFVR